MNRRTDLAETPTERDGLTGMLDVELAQELLCLMPVGDTAGVLRFRGDVMAGRCGGREGVGSHGFPKGGGTLLPHDPAEDPTIGPTTAGGPVAALHESGDRTLHTGQLE